MTPERPWYKEPMVWLVAAIPAAAVVAGFTTLFVALGSDPADSVRDRVQRTAQVQVADQAADQAARRMELSGTLKRDADTGAVVLALAGEHVSSPRLTLYLAHPTNASADIELALVQQQEQRWLGRLPAPEAGHDWRLELTPPDRDWRLRGRLRRGTTEATLRPGVTQTE